MVLFRHKLITDLPVDLVRARPAIVLATEKYQWLRESEQAFGAQLEIRLLTEADFLAFVKPCINSFIPTLSDYLAANPKHTHLAIIHTNDGNWRFQAKGSIANLRPRGQQSICARMVNSFDSPAAQRCGEKAVSEVFTFPPPGNIPSKPVIL